MDKNKLILLILLVRLMLFSSAAMDRYIDRLITFSEWPNDSLTSTVLLADDGFYYTGEGDIVQCFSCHILLGNWQESHTPSVRHLENSPDCQYAISRIEINQGSNNRDRVVDGELQLSESDNIRHNTLQADDTGLEQLWGQFSLQSNHLVYERQTGNSPIENRITNDVNKTIRNGCNQNKICIEQSNMRTERNNYQSNAHCDQSKNHEQLPINNDHNNTVYYSNSQQNQEHCNYTRYDHRLLTFTGRWPSNAPISPEEVAGAGFILLGPGDRVQCFSCRGIVYNWEYGDTAIGEHKRHFPNCPFIKKKINELLHVQKKDSNSSGVQTIKSEDDMVIKDDEVFINKGVQNDYSYKVEEYPAVQIALQMDFKPNLINLAALQILKNPNLKLNTDNLLDKILELEENNNIGSEKDSRGSLDEAMGYSAFNLQNSNKLEGPPIQNKDQTMENGPLPNNKTVDWLDSKQPTVKQNTSCYNSDQPPWNHTAILPNKPAEQTAVVRKEIELYNTTFSEDVKSLLEENSKLKETTTCKICLDSNVDLLFLPCRHLVCCENCGDQVRSCPVCRTLISATVKTFLS